MLQTDKGLIAAGPDDAAAIMPKRVKGRIAST